MTAPAKSQQEPLNPMAEKPAHVPEKLVFPFDVFNPPNIDKGFHEAWKVLQAEGVPDIVWTPYNGGHWLVTRGALISEVLSDYTTFSSRIIIVPKGALVKAATTI